MSQADHVADEVLPIPQIADSHVGEWVLIKIVDDPGSMSQARGVVLAHHADRKRMSRELKKAWKREPDAHLTVMLGGAKFGDGEALRRALTRIAAEEEFISVNGW